MEAINKIKVLYNKKVVGHLGVLSDNSIGFQYDEIWQKEGFS